MTQDLHVVTHEGDGWAVKREGNSEPVSTHPTQKEAINEAVDVAGDEDLKVIVHRKDGRIREVRSLDNGPAAEGGTSTSRKTAVVTASASLGSRVRWGAVFAGFFIALASSLTLTALGIALALCLSNVLSADWLSVFAGVWVMLSMLVSLFVGGLIISRLTVGEDEFLEPSVYGILLWSLMFFVVPLMPFAATDIGYGALSPQQQASNSQGPEISKEDLAKAGLNEEQIEAVSGVTTTPANASTWFRGNATEIAWLSFAALVISLGAAVVGAITGAQMDEMEFLTRKKTSVKAPA